MDVLTEALLHLQLYFLSFLLIDTPFVPSSHCLYIYYYHVYLITNELMEGFHNADFVYRRTLRIMW